MSAETRYANGFIPLPELGARTLILANGTLDNRVAIELLDDLGKRRIQVWSCTGDCILDETRNLPAGLHRLPIPPAGTALVERF